MSQESSKENTPQPGEGEPSARRKPYEPPSLVDYGDIATLTQTGGLTMKDFGNKKTRIG